ncbi:MAG: hypothetical protein ACLTLY_02155 [Agathobacter rectalis]
MSTFYVKEFKEVTGRQYGKYIYPFVSSSCSGASLKQWLCHDAVHARRNWGIAYQAKCLGFIFNARERVSCRYFLAVFPEICLSALSASPEIHYSRITGARFDASHIDSLRLATIAVSEMPLALYWSLFSFVMTMSAALVHSSYSRIIDYFVATMGAAAIIRINYIFLFFKKFVVL